MGFYIVLYYIIQYMLIYMIYYGKMTYSIQIIKYKLIKLYIKIYISILSLKVIFLIKSLNLDSLKTVSILI